MDEVAHEPHSLDDGCYDCGISEVVVVEPCTHCAEPLGRCIECVEDELLRIRGIGCALLSAKSTLAVPPPPGESVSTASDSVPCGLCGGESLVLLTDADSLDELPVCEGCGAFLAERAFALEVALLEASAEFRKRDMLAVANAERLLYGFPVSPVPAETAA